MTFNIAVGIIGFVVFLVLMFCGTPVPLSMAIVGFVGFMVIKGPTPAFQMVSQEFLSNFSSYTMSIAPMFAMMGFAAYRSGLGSRMFTACQHLLGHKPGGLAKATTLACTFFGAICGSSPATIGTMSAVAYPEMKKRGYHPSLPCNTIAVGATISVLIPPSLSFVILGNATELSVGRLFVSGVFPGVILTILTIITITLIVKRNPSVAPVSEKSPWSETWKSIKDGGLIEIAIIFAFSMGGMFAGWFAPTEAGAIGSALMILICVFRRTLTWKSFLQVLYDTAKLTIMVYMILACANTFSRFVAVTTIAAKLAALVKAMNLSGPLMVTVLLLFFFFMGMIADVPSITLLMIPIIYPILVDYYGYSPMWFCNMSLLMGSIGGLSPPVGISLFLTKGCIRDPDVTLGMVFRFAWYFIIPCVITVILITVFPFLVTWLPSLIYGAA